MLVRHVVEAVCKAVRASILDYLQCSLQHVFVREDGTPTTVTPPSPMMRTSALSTSEISSAVRACPFGGSATVLAVLTTMCLVARLRDLLDTKSFPNSTPDDSWFERQSIPPGVCFVVGLTPHLRTTLTPSVVVLLLPRYAHRSLPGGPFSASFYQRAGRKVTTWAVTEIISVKALLTKRLSGRRASVFPSRLPTTLRRQLYFCTPFLES